MRTRSEKTFLFLVATALLSRPMSAQIGATVPNWPVPSGFGSPGGRRALGDISRGIAFTGGMTTQGDIGRDIGFVAVTPWRIVDTSGPAGVTADRL
jgi:hypothetical protein